MGGESKRYSTTSSQGSQTPSTATGTTGFSVHSPLVPKPQTDEQQELSQMSSMQLITFLEDNTTARKVATFFRELSGLPLGAMLFLEIKYPGILNDYAKAAIAGASPLSFSITTIAVLRKRKQSQDIHAILSSQIADPSILEDPSYTENGVRAIQSLLKKMSESYSLEHPITVFAGVVLLGALLADYLSIFDKSISADTVMRDIIDVAMVIFAVGYTLLHTVSGMSLSKFSEDISTLKGYMNGDTNVFVKTCRDDSRTEDDDSGLEAPGRYIC